MSQETIRAAERAAGQVNAMSTYDPDSDQLHEECGVFGVWAPDRDVARLTYFGLRSLQHRGQESAGIAVGDGGTVMVRKDLGLLDRVFSNADLSTLSGQLAVGHVRYGTAGAKSWEASQPHLSTTAPSSTPTSCAASLSSWACRSSPTRIPRSRPNSSATLLSVQAICARAFARPWSSCAAATP